MQAMLTHGVSSESCDDSLIIVIGAGYAGLAAAYELTRLGCTNIEILEARDRAGGRAYTYAVTAKIDGTTLATVDMGPMWMDNYMAHPLKNFSERAGFTRVPTDWDDYVVYNGSDNGENITAKWKSGRSWDVEYNSMMSSVGQYDGYSGFDGTLKEAIDAVKDDADLSDLKDRKLRDFLLYHEIVTSYGFDLGNASLRFWDSSEWLGGPECRYGQDCYEYSIHAEGLGTLASTIADDLDISLSTQVTKVAIDADGVNVTTNDGTIKRAKYAVMAVPLGVLKHGSIEFDPVLPSEFATALEWQFMGDEEKFVLVFDEQFWPDVEHMYDAEPTDEDHIYWLSGSTYLSGRPAVLTAFVAGHVALRLNKMSDDDLEAHLLAALQRMLPEAAVPASASGFARSSWSNDPLTRGCWSNFASGARPNVLIETYQTPIGVDGLSTDNGRVFFAGEHTSRWYWGTVHGAWLTGIQAAAAISDRISAPGDDAAPAEDDDDDDDSATKGDASSAVWHGSGPHALPYALSLLSVIVTRTIM